MSEQNSINQDIEQLVERYLDDPRPDLKDLIMVQCASMVERIARRFSGIEAFDDLVQVGYIGLLNALGKFDRTAGVKFNTYATYLVAGEIKHYLRDRTQTIRQPAWLQELRHKVNKAAGSLTQTLGRLPTEREIAESIGVSEASVVEVFTTQEMLKVASLDAPLESSSDGEADVEKLDSADFCPEQLGLEDRMVLEQALSQLRDLERQVLVHFHFDAMNQTEIASVLGISCNYVSHILRQSLAKLRRFFIDEAEKDRVLKRQGDLVDFEILDPQIGCYTEAYFLTRLEEEVHRGSFENGSVGVVLINFRGLDSLRRFYGEESTVEFLVQATSFCRDNLRRLDMVCRLGETGLGVIFPYTGQDVVKVQERLLKKFISWLDSRQMQNTSVRVEVGYGSFPDGGKTASELLDTAKLRPIANLRLAA